MQDSIDNMHSDGENLEICEEAAQYFEEGAVEHIITSL